MTGFLVWVWESATQRRRCALAPVVPDGFLSLGVQRIAGERGRLSYAISEENSTVPVLVLEIVSQTYGGEYEEKMATYARKGVLYYVVYSPQYWRPCRHEPFEVCRLADGAYVRQSGEPVWMPEIGLGIGRELGTREPWQRDWLYWYDSAGNRYPVPEEVIEQLRQQVEQLHERLERAEPMLELERRRSQQVAARLRELGIDPESL